MGAGEGEEKPVSKDGADRNRVAKKAGYRGVGVVSETRDGVEASCQA